ncbi:MAG: hypothetical protein KQH83_07180 [Actinobacteria bacterium]|nr:hypothetical protein [Actinomycetota bacterium]
MHPNRWRTWGRYATAALAAAVIGAFAFVLRSPVPVFDWVDLGIHELGHMILMGAPRMLHFLAGSAAQVLLPLALAAYFLWKQRDLAGAGFCLAWAGTSAWDVSVYIADAPVQALPLIGGGTHDWAYLLGPQGWDAIGSAGAIARGVDLTGLAMASVGIGLAAAPAVRSLLGRSEAVPAAPAAPLPVREAADPLGAVPPSAFGAPDRLAPEEQGTVAGADPEHDPWLAASRLPFYHQPTEDRSS